MRRIGLLLLALVFVALGVTVWLGLREDAGPRATVVDFSDAGLIARGAYLARASNCMGCHTARGGAAYAGGREILTPFGSIPAPNITPDAETGIGGWSADDFWRALHNGKGKDGELLYPAFPYPSYTKIPRADADAMYAYLRNIPAVRQETGEPSLRFPFNMRPLLTAWRAWYFRPGVYQEQPQLDAQWNRGAYLVQGPGHCSACHTARNVLAGSGGADLGGGMIPMLNWYASSLTGERGGLGDWSVRDIADLLQTGVSARGTASGPMAEVVRESLQHLSPEDVQAMAVYLKSLPPGLPAVQPEVPAGAAAEQVLALGAGLYEKHCVDCHKASGSGAPPHYPALAGSRALSNGVPVNAIRAVLHGGYPPSTAGNPRPFGMPPFGARLSDEEVAALVSYIRNSWGNAGPIIGADLVNRYRAVSLD